MNEMRIFEKENSQSGQALVEYVLLLAIAVALILGLMNQLYKPFGNWMQDYMGQYLECLLDRGELPTVGGEAPEGGECTSKFQPFTLTGGRPPVGGKNGNPDENDPDSNRAGQGASASENGGSGGGSSGGSRGRSRTLAVGKNARGGADGPGAELGDNQTMEKLPESSFYKTRTSRSYSIGSTQSTSENRQGLTVPLNRVKGKDEAERSVQIPNEVQESTPRPVKRMLITPPERKVAVEEKDFEWSFGQYLKIAMIIIIIVAIVLFLGGQILQISKSMEK